jgi:hypothetical protein
MNYKKDLNLLNLLEGKRVALVGPSPHLMGKKIGSLIDTYDIVCRVNEVHPTGHEEDYGDRTDIIFHNCGTRFIDVFYSRLRNAEQISKNLKYVICPCVKASGADNWSNWDHNFESPVVWNFKRINSYNTPFHWIGIENYAKVYGYFGVEPNAGQTAILMLLQHQIKELFVTGFSFYAQGNSPSASHRPGHTNKGLENELIGNPGHPQGPQKDAFKGKLMREYGSKVIIDSYLNNLLNIGHSRVINI